jgi:MFS family permease
MAENVNAVVNNQIIEGSHPAKVKLARPAASLTRAPILNQHLLLFMAAMVLANIGGEMYGPLLPLYLKELNASVVQVGLFFTLSQIIPLALQILGLVSLPAPAVGAQLWERVGPRTPFILTAGAALFSILPVWLKFKLPKEVADSLKVVGD